MKKILICLLISLGLASVLTFLQGRSFYQLLEWKLFDLRMNLRTPPKQNDRILFVEMDDEAIEVLGRWPWPRNIFANIINVLKSLGARQILFDVTFNQPTNVIIQKDALEHIFQGKQQISDYITGEAGALKSKETLSQEDALWLLEQINGGFNAYTDGAQQKLQNAVIDNDEVLASAIQNSHVFVGYSFEVITQPQDLKNYEATLQIKKDLLIWIQKHPDATFDTLPEFIKNTPYVKTTALKDLFLRSKITLLLETDLGLTLEATAKELNEETEKIRPDFNLAKEQVIKEKLLQFLQDKPNAEFIDSIFHYEIFDPETQQNFKEVWPFAKKEFAAISKFSLPLPDNQMLYKSIKMDSPYEKFTTAVENGGFLNGIPNNDGVLRFVPLFIQYEDKMFPHIGVASVLNLYQPQRLSFESNKFFIMHNATVNHQLKDIRIPLNKNGTMVINWTGGWQDTFSHLSAAEVYRLSYLQSEAQESLEKARQLKNNLDAKASKLKKLVEGKICIIGLTAAGTHDYNPIPYEAAYPMVGTHGNVINSILTEQFITKLPLSTDLMILFGLAIVTGLCLSFLSSTTGLLFTIMILTGTFGLSFILFNQGLWMNLASPGLLALFSFVSITSYKFSTEEKAKREIKNAFSKYVSPDVIEDIMKDPSKLQLGGVRRTITVQFSDIRSFTTYCEKRQPEEVVSILNEYLDEMTKVIVAHKGTLDKYVGDEIMAVFGAPREEKPEVSAKRAVIASVKMLDRLKELHSKWAEDGLEPLGIGVGLNTGEMIVGNMGSTLRMDYTVIGDAVNLGARVEALTRNYDTDLIITEATYDLVKEIVIARPLESIKVKGKNIPVMIYAIDGLKTDKID